MSEAELTAVIADDHPTFRNGLRLMLENRGDIAVVGEAANGVEALELARESLVEITQAEPYAPIYVRLAYQPT